MQLVLKNYPSFLLDVQSEIVKSQEAVLNLVTKQKVILAWNIGRLINEHLVKNSDVSGGTYGDELIKKLSLDIGIDVNALYKMRSFYSSYPALEFEDVNLNWSHYRTLVAIKDESKRDYLEELALRNNWSVRELQSKVSEFVNNEKLKEDEKEDSTLKKTGRLRPVRGELFTYPLLLNPSNSKQKFLDLGLNVFKDVNTRIATGNTVTSLKDENGDYSFKSVSTSKRKMNIYKASLERVVDGDTIRVILDLGFGTFHREILRLKGINAPEKNSNEGKRSKQVLESILKNVEFLIIKTVWVDVFGRYVADVFFDEGKNNNIDPKIVADSGSYLNQILLDRGVAQII